MLNRRLARLLRTVVVALSATLLVGAVATGSWAQVDPAVVQGKWTEPFEEGGVGTARCVADGTGFIVCKATAYSSALLPDGRVLYHNGLESQENQDAPTVLDISPGSRDAQSRILDVSKGTPTWETPTPERGGQANPNIKPGSQGYTDPTGSGAPGRPGDGFVGAVWGKAGLPPGEPSSPPDDPVDNDGDLFCSEVVSLPDGRVLFAGGTDWYNEPSLMDKNEGDPANVGLVELEGIRNSLVFDPATDAFTPAGHMTYGRWYPTGVVLPDGKVLIASGVTQLITNAQLGNVRRTETFDPATGAWAENYASERSDNSLPLLARLVVAPNGKVFYGGVGQAWSPAGYSMDELTWNLMQYYDPQTKEWEVIGPALLGNRSTSFQVALPMADPYKKLTLITGGGSLGPTPSTYLGTPLVTSTTLDADGTVTAKMVASMNRPRWFGSGVALPDGNIFVVGGADRDEVIDPGSEIPVKTPELYDVKNDKWIDMSTQTRDRTYHHTALLLPDMRVLLGGHAPIGSHYGGRPTDQGPMMANNDKDSSFEIWTPPYLLRGPRPIITRVQAGIAYGEAFDVEAPEAGGIEEVLLMRTTSVQHVTDGDQRTLLLPFKADGDTLSVTAPPNGIAAPPGYYYLVVNKKTAEGPIPSVARIVQVGMGTNPADAPAPFGDDALVGGSATPLDDSSYAARGQEAMAEVTQGTPAEPAVAAVSEATASANEAVTPAAAPPGAPVAPVERELSALPASFNSPLRPPALSPAAGLGAAGLATVVTRRALRRRYARARPPES